MAANMPPYNFVHGNGHVVQGLIARHGLARRGDFHSAGREIPFTVAAFNAVTRGSGYSPNSMIQQSLV
jgi:hypothetical protein